jgi:multiple sugar transport system ATP-binding protein
MPKDRDVAVAFETYALYPQRTVRENLAFPLNAPMRKDQMSQAQVQDRVLEIAELLGIGELIDRLPRQLSGGQRQRVALGRALVRKPKAYLLDEPIAHLDAKLRHRMRGELKRIQMSLGITTLYTTPDQLEALSLADHMAVLNEGRIEQVGTPADVYKRPVNLFVARFVGDPPMNIIASSLVDDSLNLIGLAKIPIRTDLKSRLVKGAGGDLISVGIRPKDLTIVPESDPQAQFKAEVKHVQVLGETSIVSLVVDSHDLRAKLSTQAAPSRGEHVGLNLDLADCHYFNPQTQLRVD